MRTVRLLVTLALVGVACTAAPSQPPGSGSSSPPVGTFLASGAAVPEGCAESSPSGVETIEFVAGARAWALDPSGGGLTCLFPTDDPGPFAWGPQGDRVLLGGLEVRGVEPEALTHPNTGETISAFDWGHPHGIAIVYADPSTDGAHKLYLEDQRFGELTSLPSGRYLQIAYHPSGLALAFVVERNDRQSIWLSTNEGKQAERLVFSEVGTTYPSIAFTSNGKLLYWTAQHAEGYPEIHWMRLDDRSSFASGWKGTDQTISNLRLAPGTSSWQAFDLGDACDDRQATLVHGAGDATPALDAGLGSSSVVGWLSPTTVLVAAGSCAGPLDVYAVDVDGFGVTPLVSGVTIAASRAPAPATPLRVPTPTDEEPPPGGLG